VPYNGQFEIPTFAEVIELLAAHAHLTGHRAGIYPETKHPSHFLEEGRHLDGSRIGIDLGAALLATLLAEGFTDPARVFIQSFEIGNLRALKARQMPAAGLALPLIQLIEPAGAPYDTVLAGNPQPYTALLSPDGLREVARYAAGIGPHKGLLLPRDAHEALAPATAVIAAAHAEGLAVHAWTFRAENHFLPGPLRRGAEPAAHGRLEAEIRAFRDAGLDGVFCDHPDYAVRVRDA